MFDQNATISSLTEELMKQKESIILAQLGDLVKKGLLVCKESYPFIDRALDQYSGEYKYTLRQSIVFELKDKEYIEKLEDDNRRLKIQLENIEIALSKMFD